MMSKDLHIEIEAVGPAALHNLMCWMCEERKAVYHMYPTWCFGPCWECNAEIGGRLERTHGLEQRLLRAFRRHG